MTDFRISQIPRGEIPDCGVSVASARSRATPSPPAPGPAPAPYTTPILDDVARRAFARLVLAGPQGMTVRELAEEIAANPSTVGNVLRGSSAYGSSPFARAGREGQAYRWRVRGIGGRP